jgi:beta-lactamase regulating signal transducer with metallopeptidase domain
MIALWLIYGTAVAALLALGALAMERMAAALRRPRRWGYSAALLLALAIPAVGAMREPAAPAASTASVRVTPAGERTVRASGATGWIMGLLDRAGPARALDASAFAALDRPLAIAWGATVVVLSLGYLFAMHRLGRSRRRWREETVDDVPVLVASTAGPAVVGTMRPRIVLPEWALALDETRRSLMVAHEREHVRARDPLLTHLAALAALLMPWNVAAWWMLRRLRLAVELDCDARVLDAARALREDVAARRAYGDLLLTVAARHARSLPVLAPALLERTSSLSRRIHAMHSNKSRRPLVQAALGACAAALLVAAACEAPSPKVLAPDGEDHAATRLMGKTSVALASQETLTPLVSRYFPEVLRGETGPAILFIVRDAKGEIVRTTRAEAPDEINQKLRTSGDPTREDVRAMETTPMKIKRSADHRPMTGPPGMEDITPDRIAAVDVSKFKAGTFGPNPVSVITINLK